MSNVCPRGTPSGSPLQEFLRSIAMRRQPPQQATRLQPQRQAARLHNSDRQRVCKLATDTTSTTDHWMATTNRMATTTDQQQATRVQQQAARLQ